jgi:hypothetical protein
VCFQNSSCFCVSSCSFRPLLSQDAPRCILLRITAALALELDAIYRAYNSQTEKFIKSIESVIVVCRQPGIPKPYVQDREQNLADTEKLIRAIKQKQDEIDTTTAVCGVCSSLPL